MQGLIEWSPELRASTDVMDATLHSNRRMIETVYDRRRARVLKNEAHKKIRDRQVPDFIDICWRSGSSVG